MKRRLLVLVFCTPLLACASVAGKWLSLVPAVQERRAGVYQVDFGQCRQPAPGLPIGVFDSGIGGLTVLDAILTLDAFNNLTGAPGSDGRPDFEQERFIYLGDQANMPYGNYPAEGKTDYLRELVLKDALFLLGDRFWGRPDAEAPGNGKPAVKAIVIACNTATAYGLADVRYALEQWGLPIFVIGLVEAGAREAVEKAGASGAIGVLATAGTCSSMGYVRAIESEAGRKGIEPPPVVQQGSLGLAGAIEGDRAFIGWSAAGEYRGPAKSNPAARIDTSISDRYGFDPAGLIGDSPADIQLNSVENYLRYDVLSLVENYLGAGGEKPVRAVILGCTHFPFYRKNFVQAFERLRTLETADGKMPYGRLLDTSLVFVDPSVRTAEELYRELSRRGILLDDSLNSICPTDEFYISIPAPSFPGAVYDKQGAFAYEFKYGRSEGNFQIEDVRRTPMSKETLSPENQRMIQDKMPALWARLVRFNHQSPRFYQIPDSLKLE